MTRRHAHAVARFDAPPQPAAKLIAAVGAAAGYSPHAVAVRAGTLHTAAGWQVDDGADVERRVQERLATRERRRQTNIEAVIERALQSLPNQVGAEPVAEDWIWQFIEGCQDVGDDEMRVLWARLLAGEVATPGTFSLRTLRCVRDLSKPDARQFTALCTFVWMVPGFGLTPLVMHTEGGLLERIGLDYAALLHLAAAGLLEVSSPIGFHLRQVDQAAFSYFGRSHLLRSPTGKRDLDIGKVLLTGVGRELVAIAGALPLERHRNGMLDLWRQAGWRVD